MIRGSIIVGCVVVLALAVMPNFAQDYGQIQATGQVEASVDQMTPDQMRELLKDVLTNERNTAAGETPSAPLSTPGGGGVSYDQSLIN